MLGPRGLNRPDTGQAAWRPPLGLSDESISDSALLHSSNALVFFFIFFIGLERRSTPTSGCILPCIFVL